MDYTKLLQPNVFFLIIDSFRNDEFEKFCKKFPNSHLNKLVKNGVYFSQTISSADATYRTSGVVDTLRQTEVVIRNLPALSLIHI